MPQTAHPPQMSNGSRANCVKTPMTARSNNFLGQKDRESQAPCKSMGCPLIHHQIVSGQHGPSGHAQPCSAQAWQSARRHHRKMDGHQTPTPPYTPAHPPPAPPPPNPPPPHQNAKSIPFSAMKETKKDMVTPENMQNRGMLSYSPQPTTERKANKKREDKENKKHMKKQTIKTEKSY